MFNYRLLDADRLEFVPVVPVEELPEGERLFLDVGGSPVVVFNLAGGLFAIGDVCTHDNGPLGEGALEDGQVVCPRHGARFDLQTGRAVRLPAVQDIPAYPLRVRDGMIEIGIPLDQ